MRRGQDTAMSEGARPELRCAVHPADHAVGRELVGNPFDHRGVFERNDYLIVLARRPRQLLRVYLGSPEGMIGHVAVRVAEINAVGVERRAHCATGVAGSRRNEQALEAGFGKYPCVGDAVERHAAAKTQIRQAGLLMKRARDVDQRVFEYPLDAGGAIREASTVRGLEIDRVVGVTRWPEQLDEPRGVRSTRGRLVLEVLRDEREGAIRSTTNQLADLAGQCRPPVGGQAHDLVLVLVDREAEIRGEGRIQHAERMREPDFAEQCDVRTAVAPPLAVTY